MASRAARTIYQFPISHFAEKARWCLDAKGLPYTVKNLVPGPHVLVARWLSGNQTVPVLVDGGATLGDSTAIALHLERAYPLPPLLPRDPSARARVLALEEEFDERVGQNAKRFLYGRLMEEGPGRASGALMEAYPWPVRLFGRLLASTTEPIMQSREGIDAGSVARARAVLIEGAARIEEETGGDPSRYLVGDTLTLADITAASLLGPIVAPPESPWARIPSALPLDVQALRRELRARPGGQWVMERYRRDRSRPSARRTEGGYPART